MKEERVILVCVFDQPSHRVQYILSSGPGTCIARVISEQHNVFAAEPVMIYARVEIKPDGWNERETY
jgi:hypothetical protein